MKTYSHLEGNKFWLSSDDARNADGPVVVCDYDRRRLGIKKPTEETVKIGLLMSPHGDSDYVVKASNVSSILRSSRNVDVVFLTDVHPEHLDECSGLVLPDMAVLTSMWVSEDFPLQIPKQLAKERQRAYELYRQFFARAREFAIPILGIDYGARAMASVCEAKFTCMERSEPTSRRRIVLRDGVSDIFGHKSQLFVFTGREEIMNDHPLWVDIIGWDKDGVPVIWMIKGCDAIGIDIEYEYNAQSVAMQYLFRWLVDRAQYYAVRKSL